MFVAGRCGTEFCYKLVRLFVSCRSLKSTCFDNELAAVGLKCWELDVLFSWTRVNIRGGGSPAMQGLGKAGITILAGCLGVGLLAVGLMFMD